METPRIRPDRQQFPRLFPPSFQQFTLFIPTMSRSLYQAQLFTQNNVSTSETSYHVCWKDERSSTCLLLICLECPLAASKSFARCISAYPLLLCLNCPCCSHSTPRINRNNSAETAELRRTAAEIGDDMGPWPPQLQ